MKEIVGAQIGSTITNSPSLIRANLSQVTAFLDREHVQLMAACDLGKNWENMANGPTLFYLDDNGKPFPAQPPTDE